MSINPKIEMHHSYLNIGQIIADCKEHFFNPAYFGNIRQHLPTVKQKPIQTIAIFYHRMRNGGTERVLSKLIPIWKTQRVEVILLTEEPSHSEDYFYGNEIKRYIVPTGREPKNYAEHALLLSNLLVEHKVDLFITNDWANISGYWDILVARALSIPVIMGWHDTFDAKLHDLHQARQFLIAKDALRCVNLLAVLSRVDELFFRQLKIPAQLIPNPTTFDDIPAPTKKSKINNLIWIARVERNQKQIDDALYVFAEVLKKIPDATLDVVGDGTHLKDAEELVCLLGIEKAVHFHGYQLRPEKFIENATLHMMTSKNEGAPMILSEVWSHGIPSVMYDLPYLEYLRLKKGYVAVPQGDQRALADAIIHLLQNTERRKLLASEAYDAAKYFYSVDSGKVWKGIFDWFSRSQDIAELSNYAGILPDPEALHTAQITIQKLTQRIEELASKEMVLHHPLRIYLRENLPIMFVRWGVYILRAIRFLKDCNKRLQSKTSWTFSKIGL